MSLKNLMELAQRHYEFEDEYLKKLIDGDISVDQYLNFAQCNDRFFMRIAKTFDNFNDFKTYLEMNYPNEGADDARHELEHYEIGKKHGLKRMTFGLLDYGERGYETFVIDHLGENCMDWSRERILRYSKDTYGGVSDPSEDDLRTLNLFKSCKPGVFD